MKLARAMWDECLIWLQNQTFLSFLPRPLAKRPGQVAQHKIDELLAEFRLLPT